MKKIVKRGLAVALAAAMVIGMLLTGASAATHTVAAGDNLSKIAEQYLGDASRWREIYEANKDTISDPNSIYVGQTLVIPGTEETPADPVDPVAPAVEEESVGLAMVKVESGWYMGTKEEGVYTFLGMQYGVAERFKSAVKPEPFAGIHAALTYGNTCPTSNQSTYGSVMNVTSYMTPNANYVEDEDCLYINVWSTSMEPTAEMPVLFWIHGGGFSTGGSNELTYYDGLNFAKSQDVVFVSINHRLNVLGYTDLSAYGDEYKNSGNLGQEDIVLALQWVRDNIANFGGDPDNVTIMGQSGGGSKVTSLLTTAPAAGLFHKAIACSGGGAISQTKEQSQAAGTALVEKAKETYGLATDEEALAKLAEIDYAELVSLSAGTGVGNGPTIDGEFIVASPIDAEGNFHEMANNIPMMITSTFAEFSGSIANATISALINNSTPFMGPTVHEFYISTVDKSCMSEQYKEDQLTQKYGDLKDAIVAAFAKAYPELEAFDVTRIDTGFRAGAKSMAMGRAASSDAATYHAVFAYEFPIFGGTMAWHTGGDLPFLFNNLDDIPHMIAGDSANAQKLADYASTALGNFCRVGDPSTDDLAWPAFTAEKGETMIITTDSQVRYHHDAELMDLLNQLPSSGMPF